ncbi:Orotidine 5'-phosphate decarboxylase domain-containing protein [Lipomyces chichibuensis]|uniref:Orotidine 5'-phosphate decarboxylase domain-containing protein n=1 Tax=Lipomyces chichibuensis TaxID=1546026 RepID=UPI00334311D6
MSRITLKPYEDRITTHSSPLARRLLKIMTDKKTNLCVSLDVDSKDELLRLADALGPYVCVFKTHVDTIEDYTYESVIVPLVELSKRHNFLIFEDRKFADIGSTVKSQYTSGIFKIAQWAHITNAHALPGPGIIDGLYSGTKDISEERGLLLLAEMSSAGSLATGDYTDKTVDLARRNRVFTFGFIAQNRLGADDEDFIIMTPGVGLDDKGDGLGQQYRTVDDAVSGGSDIIIVGRGIFAKGRDPVAESKRYRDAGWKAYIARVK